MVPSGPWRCHSQRDPSGLPVGGQVGPRDQNCAPGRPPVDSPCSGVPGSALIRPLDCTGAGAGHVPLHPGPWASERYFCPAKSLGELEISPRIKRKKVECARDLGTPKVPMSLLPVSCLLSGIQTSGPTVTHCLSIFLLDSVGSSES